MMIVEKPVSVHNFLREKEVRAPRPHMVLEKLHSASYFINNLRLSKSLESHRGCVNSVLFSDCGRFIFTGSDDLTVKVFSFQEAQCRATIRTSHSGNIFFAKELPGSKDVNRVLTCGADGKVVLTTNGPRPTSETIYQHRGRAHRIAFSPLANGAAEDRSSECFYSCGEDGRCCLFDLRSGRRSADGNGAIRRTPEFSFLFTNANPVTNVPGAQSIRRSIYSIQCNPSNSFEVALAGSHNCTLLYDTRHATTDTVTPVAALCPTHLLRSRHSHITGLRFSANGSFLVASYSGDDVYCFGMNQASEEVDGRTTGGHLRYFHAADGSEDQPATSSGTSPAPLGYYRSYSGHENIETVKQVSILPAVYTKSSPKGDGLWVASGSDDGRMLIWELATGRLVKEIQRVDSVGAVNCITPHPWIAGVVAASGLSHRAKLLFPASLDTDGEATEATTAGEVLDEAGGEEDDDVAQQAYLRFMWRLMRRLRAQADQSSDEERDEEGDEEESDSAMDDDSDEESQSGSEDDDDEEEEEEDVSGDMLVDEEEEDDGDADGEHSQSSWSTVSEDSRDHGATDVAVASSGVESITDQSRDSAAEGIDADFSVECSDELRRQRRRLS